MPPSKHAVLSASGAHRWLHCNPSARLELEFADRETEAAADGTAAHALAEPKLKKALKIRSRKPVSPYDCDEMDVHTDGYVEFVLEQLEEARALCADPLVLIEQRLDFSCYVPDGFGTGDCLIVADKLLHIIDFKYGQGVPVSCENNPQLMYYALGAYALFAATDEIQTVRMSIVQPRIQEEPETFEMPLADLLDWAEKTLQPAAMLAWEGKGNFAPGEKQCRFCKAYPTCRAWQDKYGDLAGFDPLPQPATLSDEELGEWLRKLVGLADYARDLVEYAQQALLDGHQIPGWKLVEGRSTRKWSDQDAAFRQMQAAGIDEAMLYTRTPISLTVAEKMIGKKKFAETMSAFITKAPGAPKLANDSDPRPAYNNLDGFKAEED